jgi:hypothetical protein
MITQKIPAEIIEALETELRGLSFGTARLEVHVHDGKLRFIISREQSIIPGQPSSGAATGGHL